MKLLDGGFGTTLRDQFGVDDTNVWSLRPIVDGNYHLFNKCHQLYINAGCDIITTGNYSATPYYLQKGNLDQTLLPDYIKKCGDIAHQLKIENKHKHKFQIAGCLPPYGESYQHNSLFRAQDIIDHFKITATQLYDTCDFYLAETIASQRDAVLISNTLYNYHKPLYISFCVKPDGETLLDGTSIKDTLRLINYNIKGVMFNCSPIQNIDQAVTKMTQTRQTLNLKLEIGAYPNKHQEIVENFTLDKYQDTIKYQDLTTKEFANFAKRWYHQGVDIIGGCCGIGPEYIRELANNNL